MWLGEKEWSVVERGSSWSSIVQELRERWLKSAVVSYQIAFRLTRQNQNIQT